MDPQQNTLIIRVPIKKNNKQFVLIWGFLIKLKNSSNNLGGKTNHIHMYAS